MLLIIFFGTFITNFIDITVDQDQLHHEVGLVRLIEDAEEAQAVRVVHLRLRILYYIIILYI